MARQKEAQFRDRIKPQLESLPHSRWYRIEQQSIRGTPDTLGLIRGIFVAIEFKKSYKDKPTPLQKYNLQKIADAGGVAIIACPENWEAIFTSLAEMAMGSGEGVPEGTSVQ